MSKGDGTVYLRGKVWYIKFYRDKQQVVMSCPGLTAAQAKEKLKSELRKSNDEFVAPREKRITISELVEDLRTNYDLSGRDDISKSIESSWRLHLESFFGAVRAVDMSTELQRKYRAARSKDGASIATVNREIQFMRRAFKVAAEQDPPKIKRVPKFVLLKENNARKGFVTVPQMVALKSAALKYGVEWRLLLELAHWLGWRRNELLNLKVSNVRLHDGTIRLEADETKNGNAREVPLTATLRDFIIPFVVGRQAHERIFSFKCHRRTWLRITKDAGMPDLLFHDLRRSSARTKRSAGVDVSVIMKMMGWETDSMFRRYGIVVNEDMAQALATQEAFEQRMLTTNAQPMTIDAKIIN